MKLRTQILAISFLSVLAAWPFRSWISNLTLEHGMLANDAPPPEVFEEMIDNSHDPAGAVVSAWNTGKPALRSFSITAVRKIVAGTNRIPDDLEPLVHTAAFDLNLNVRETAFRILRKCHDPSLGAFAAAQLRDCDPEVRLMGAGYFKWLKQDEGVPLAVELLDDGDPRLVATGLTLLERWTGQNFGLKLNEVASGIPNEQTGLKEFRQESQARCRTAAKQARAWWWKHQSEFAQPESGPAALPPTQVQPIMAPEFEASALDGHTVNLSQFRGKIVVLHFWATPRAGTQSQLKDLTDLQRKYENQLAVIAVSLDTVVDDDGDLGGEDDDDGPHDRARHRRPPLGQIRQNVARAVKEYDLTYPVIVDDHFAIGGKFNAAEPPITVIIDTNGLIRRQFTGCRSLPILEAMLAGAGLPGVGSNVVSPIGSAVVLGRWENECAFNQTMREIVAPWLSTNLTAQTAAAVALLNNRAIQFDFETIGVSKDDLAEAARPRNSKRVASWRFPNRLTPLTDVESSAAGCLLEVLALPAQRKVEIPNLAEVKLQAADKILQLADETQSAFYTLQARAEIIKQLQVIVEVYDAVTNLARRQFEAGNIAELEWRNQQEEDAQARFDLMQAQSDALREREILTRCLGLSGAQVDWQIADQLPPLPPNEGSLDDLKSLAVSKCIDLGAWRNRVESIYTAFPDGAAPNFDQNPSAPGRLISELQRAEDAYTAEDTRVLAEVTAAYRALIAARETVEFAQKKLLPLRQQILDETYLHYNAMEKSPYDLLLAKKGEQMAEQKRVESLRDYWLVRVKLERAVGGQVNSQNGLTEYAKP